MKTSFISTFTLSNTARNQITSQTSTLNKLQLELASGRKADVGLDLGGRTGDAVSLRSDFRFFNSIIDTNELAKSRLDIAQAAMDDIRTSAEDLQSTLIGVRDTGNSAPGVAAEADAGLQQLIARLNTQLGGSYLFSGINSDVPPINDYYANPASPNKTAADGAFFTEFGFAQTDPGVAGITPAQMDTYLNGNFEALFTSPNWETNWSTATDQTAQTRIAAREEVETSVSANEQAFRDVASVFVMLSDLGNLDLPNETQKVVVDKAIEKLGSIVGDLADIQGSLGISQERVKLASERLDVQTNILNEGINSLENVDKEETAVRLNTAITQLEISYSISSRIQQLSIMRYL
ncbi:flagellar hook-associated protein 3 FlgL [Roseibium hamelinense]|uniref:Flagellin n=1 Tax=Roseibium hamelinense TaxID=150831 RepID=A0A562TI17_9HYPH|nr:flagellar hook-associated family protein [Roseibium hamelinense]MTI45911.1 flagellar hook-associated family protein [Roseibium hamelinense]TWI92904.1 flagellar hook-associated protein 3 FlgL [Roseibium hamelinense]